MKKLSIITLLTALLVVSACSPDTTTLNISVSGSSDSLFLYFSANKLAPDTLYIKDSKPVKIKFTNREISQIRFMYAQSYTRLFVEPGHEYRLSLDVADGKMKFTIDDNALQQYHNIDNGRNIYSYEWIRDYSAMPYDTVAARMKENFEQLITRDCQLFESAKMSKELSNALHQDTELYWLAALTKVIRNNYISYYRDGVPMYPDYGSVWKSIYEEHPVGKAFLQSEWLYHYVQAYLFYDLYSRGTKPDFKGQAGYWDFQYATIYKSLPDKKVQENVLAEYLYMDCLNNPTNDRALTGHLNRFMEEYPHNPNNAYFKSYINELEEYYRIISQDFSPEVKFVEGYQELATLKDVFAKFKGKPLFVDFWFSTCSPCIREFGQSAGLKKLLKENGITPLYISIDTQGQEENWKNSIKRYNLEGYHIRAQQALHVDMDENYGVRLFPHYMIVDANGKIVVDRAKNPSSGEELLEQIRTSLKL